MDPMSDNKIWFPMSLGAEKEHEKQLLERLGVEKNFKNPRRFADIGDQELVQYAGIFLPGGHAPMTDLWNDKDLGRILMYFHNKNKPTGECGPSGGMSCLGIKVSILVNSDG